jgi:hypothetical protein
MRDLCVDGHKQGPDFDDMSSFFSFVSYVMPLNI